MRLVRILLGLAALSGGGAGAWAQPVTSAGPDSVSVTVYRAPDRSPQQALQLGWLGGYALITEQRRVVIPEGRAVIRFEGVAARILPESAIVTGLPGGVREKNLDAELLSGHTLYERSLGRPVTIRRQLHGRTVEERAIIRSGSEGAAIVQTADGFTAVNCGPGDDTIVYDSAPPGLSAKPTLSVETVSARTQEVTLTLSYLAWGFDWQANYVATMRPDGRSADLFAWLTLANGDVTGFADAQTMVVAGKIKSGDAPERLDTGAGDVDFRCYPSPIPEDIVSHYMGALPQPMPEPAPAPMAMAPAMDIVVTGNRARMAKQEELGDLKLYRVPQPTAVAAMSQKQVALLDKSAVRMDVLYRSFARNDYINGPRLVLRAQNRESDGLGLPLPAGPVAVFEPRDGERLLVGEGFTDDKAVNEEVEVELGAATQVTARLEAAGTGRGWRAFQLSITNANPFAIRYEAEIEDDDDGRLSAPSQRLSRKRGRHLWRVEVPANGRRTLRYRLTAPL